jgi:predicted metalloendopeptidase
MSRSRSALRDLVIVLTAAAAAVAAPSAGVDLAGMDRSIAPGDDFFMYANGAWIKATEIPADRASYGVGAIVGERTEKRTVELIQAAAKPGGATDPEAKKVGDYYAAFMDEGAIEAAGLRPLQPTLARIAAIKDRRALAAYLGSTLRADVDVINNTSLHTDNVLGLWIAQDLSDPSRYLPFLLQGGLDMADRRYYLDPTPAMEPIRAKFKVHVANVLRLAGVEGAPAKADAVVALETKIARTHTSREDSEDVERGNNHWPPKELATRAPGLDWEAFLGAAGLTSPQELVIWQPDAVKGFAAVAASEPLEVWKDYLTFHAVEHVSAFLPKAFVAEAFDFHGKAVQGVAVDRDRWKRGVAATSAALGEAVGKMYVAKYFPAGEKARAQAMVANISAAFARRIDSLAWMSPETKAKAKAKLAVLVVGVGYPDRWRDYSGLSVSRSDALGNAQRAELFELRRNLAKLGRPVDRHEWVMNPQLVNAVNLPAMNALNFPAGMLQPPYFDPDRPIAMDYGAIGSVMGHEISHSFDNQGALFDADGRLANWWTPQDFDHFTASTKKLAAQYDGYKPFPDAAVNGTQTLGENIADIAGLSAAFDAYRAALGGKSAPLVDGLTGDQQFFISFAQAWRTKPRDLALRQQLVVDGHAPGRYRADTVRNLDPWYAAFAPKPGQALFLAPEARVRIW